MKKGFIRSFLLFVLIFAALSVLLFWIIKDDWRQTVVKTDAVNGDAILPDLDADVEIRQDFEIAVDRMLSITLQANKRPGIAEDGQLTVSIVSNNQELVRRDLPYSGIGDDGRITVPLEKAELPRRGSRATIVLRAEGGISFWYGYSRAAGKHLVNVETEGLSFQGERLNGELVMAQNGLVYLQYSDWYWPGAAFIFLALTAMILYCHSCRIRGRLNAVNKGIDLVKQYRYLLKTLVIRDFKIKYKASVLGILWSFLNPLLMTLVYFFVFSTLFRSSIENFVVYLMSGIVLFNFFSEATNLGMQSIVGNAGLITKVYVPKYIFPISKALSSGINLCISLLPLLIVMAFTGVHFSKSLLLIPVVLIFLILFCVGVSLILAAAMVYFRDIQFLWGILLTILNFLSPIFYPETIIPARFIGLYHMNPMYQYLFFMRTITLGGISPTPVTYLYCFLASTATLLIGLFVFRLTQSRFVLHL